MTWNIWLTAEHKTHFYKWHPWNNHYHLPTLTFPSLKGRNLPHTLTLTRLLYLPHFCLQRSLCSLYFNPKKSLPSRPGRTVLLMASTKPSGDPKRKKSDTSNSNLPRFTSERLESTGGRSAPSFNTLEWMLNKENTESKIIKRAFRKKEHSPNRMLRKL